MARGHGRILTSIWEDEDFTNLGEPEQRMYLFLISQPNLNHAGLLPLTLRRWSRKARGLTVAELEKRLAALEETRFIVVDDDTEELLIRTFVRNDGVWRMPKVMAAMVSGAGEISSMRLRRALLVESERLPLDELSDEPSKLRGGGEGPSVRAQIEEHLTNLRRTLRVPDPTPPNNPTRKDSDTFSEPFAKGPETLSEPFGNPSGTPGEPTTRGRARTSHARTPAPAPAPIPSPIKEGGGDPSGQAPPDTKPAPRSDDRPAPIDDDGFQLTDAMRRWATDTFGNTLDVDYETAQFIDHHRADGRRRSNWPAAWQKWMRQSAKWQSERAQRGNVVALPAAQRPSTTDTRVQAALNLGRQMQAEADARQEAQ
ncbi:hypothetical protein K378_01385 [Streptomyces sp. Amel2xB2]|uniref:hypothetical protein n=1 Tax=Streptomyces sp. Amel2xB2 TaxID=1305829 RepID=UPI000DB94570|nr:hypothetical protein [Streptomyces sp. Amel2xB2]RAJ70220.1 hypothetical protein K378_01385 [Streptomyces sp. Amel2xB2]